jgi:heterogeneous nuclear ribonucleoprotein F/H
VSVREGYTEQRRKAFRCLPSASRKLSLFYLIRMNFLGDAIVEFETEDLMEIAMKKNREHLGNRFVVLTREKDHQSPPKNRPSGNNRGGDHNDQLRFPIKMSGLPYRLSEREIIDWFLPLTCARVRILKNRDNKPSGEAIAEFNNEEDANNAMKKNKKYLGDRFVVLTCQWS